MATLEESLILHDKFTQTLQKADRITQNIIGTFEKLKYTMRDTFSFTPTIKGLDRINIPQPRVEELNTSKLKNLYTQMDNKAHEIVEAFSNNNTKGINQLQKEYQELYQELSRVESKASQVAGALASVGSRSTVSPVGKGGISPPETRISRLKIMADTSPAESSVQKFSNWVKNLKLNPLQNVGAHSKQEAMTLGGVVEDLRRGIASIQGVTQGVSNSLATAFNKVPLVNTLSNSLDSLRAKLLASESASNSLNTSMSRTQLHSQNYSLMGQSLAFVKSQATSLALTLLGVKRNNDQLSNSMRRVSLNAKNYTKIGSYLALAKSQARGFHQALMEGKRNGQGLLYTLSLLPGPLGKASRAAQNFSNHLKNAQEKGNSINKIATLMTFQVAIRALKAVFNLMQGIVDKADNYVQTMNRLKIANDGTETFDQFNDKIMASALRARTAYGDVSQTVSRLAINARDAFKGNDEVITFAENLNKLYKISGATLAEQQGSMIQLTQAMARGTLRGEELNSVWEQGPLIIQKIADYLGITQGKLKEMADEGGITADIVKSAILAATDDISKSFEEMDMTFGQMVENFKTMSIGAFQPLIESWNKFINSVIGQKVFEGLTQAVFIFGSVVDQVFNQLVIPAMGWLIENIDKVAMALTLLGTVAAVAGAVLFTSFLLAHIPFLILIGVIGLAVMAFDQMGITAGQVAGFIVGAVAFVATSFYDAVIFVAGLFVLMVQTITNIMKFFANMILSVVEFFMNVWTHPIYSVKKLFYDMVSGIINFFSPLATAFGNASDALGKAFVNGANIAIRAVNKLISLLNSIPGVNVGSIGELASFGGGGISFDTGKGLLNSLDPGPAPEGYKTLDKWDYSELNGLTNALDNLKNPFDSYNSASKWVENSLSGIGSGFQEFMDRMNVANMSQADFTKGLSKIYDPSNFGGGGGSGSGGKKPNVGTVDKVKDAISISDEDLKYLRDIAERNFVLKYQQITPSAVVNLQGSGSTEEDAKSLLEKLEEMIVDQTAQILYT